MAAEHPETLDNVARRATPDPGVLDRYLRTGTPVILTGMLDGTGADTAGDRDPAVRLVAAAIGDSGGEDDGWTSRSVGAGPGTATHLHCPGDLRPVLRHLVRGRERHVLIDGTETAKLLPVRGHGHGWSSGLALPQFSREDLDAFLHYVRAWDCLLSPGETLAVPTGMWRYVEHLDETRAIEVGLGRHRYTRTLAALAGLAGHRPGVELHALAVRFRDPAILGPAELAAFAQLEEACRRAHRHTRARDEALRVLCFDLCRQLGLAVAGPAYHLDEVERREQLLGQLDAHRGRAPGQRPRRGRRRWW